MAPELIAIFQCRVRVSASKISENKTTLREIAI
jgi:hypothetical protein